MPVPMPMLMRGRWLAGHVTVLAVTVAFVALGFWQLDRHHEKQAKVRAARAAYAAPAPELAGAPDPAPGTRVQATGTYDPAVEVLLRDRLRGDSVGHDVLTRLRLADGTAVIVDRGWIDIGLADPARTARTAPPATEVVVRGLARASRPLSPRDSVRDTGGRLSLPRVDLARIAALDSAATGAEPLRTIWIEAQYQSPRPAAGAPRLPEPPPPDRVNHLQYALQWWSFAAIPVVGWPIVLRRVAGRARRPAPGRASTADA
jgi:cytochrome oxidase assembly protein ShyY1